MLANEPRWGRKKHRRGKWNKYFWNTSADIRLWVLSDILEQSLPPIYIITGVSSSPRTWVLPRIPVGETAESSSRPIIFPASLFKCLSQTKACNNLGPGDMVWLFWLCENNFLHVTMIQQLSGVFWGHYNRHLWREGGRKERKEGRKKEAFSNKHAHTHGLHSLRCFTGRFSHSVFFGKVSNHSEHWTNQWAAPDRRRPEPSMSPQPM